MTERKPDNVSWESWIERQIQDGQRGGAFDQLSGHGRPIVGLTSTHDDMWWVKAKLRDEEIDFLPPTIAIRAERAAAVDAAMSASNEAHVRRILDEVNARIRWVNSHATAGPPSTAVVIDVDEFLDRWRASRPTPPPHDSHGAVEQPEPGAIAQRSQRRWRRWSIRRRAL